MNAMPLVSGHGKNLYQLMSGRSYNLEYFQRRYVWGQQQVTQLVTDLTEKFLKQWKETHPRIQVKTYDPWFLGPIVTYERDQRVFLVDGQQRFVTLVLLVLHLRRLLIDRQDTESAGFLGSLVSTQQFGRMTYTIDDSEYRKLFDALFNQRTFNADGEPEHLRRALAAYDTIKATIPAVIQADALPFFVDWLKDRVSMVEIGAGEWERAREIFMSMNDRGVQLKPIDHLKAFILDDALDIDGRRRADDIWQRMVVALERRKKESSIEFFKAVLRARFARTNGDRTDQSSRELEEATHEWVRTNQSLIIGPEGKDGDLAARLTDLFEPLSEAYRLMLRASAELVKGLEPVYFNAHNGIVNQFDLTFACLHPADKPSARLGKIHLVASFVDTLFVRHVVNNERFDEKVLDLVVERLLAPLRTATAVDEVRAVLADALAQEDLSIAEIENLRLRENGPELYYVLARMTAWLEVGAGRPDPLACYLTKEKSPRPFHIEHLLAKARGGYQSEFKDDDDYRYWRSRFGALLLLPGPENSGFGAKHLSEKAGLYPPQNLLAASVSPDIKKASFASLRRFLRQQKLHPYMVTYDSATLVRTLIQKRAELYREVAERIWGEEVLGFVVKVGVNGQAHMKRRTRRSYGVDLEDLIRTNLLAEHDVLMGVHGGRTHFATMLADGRMRTSHGAVFDSPSRAAMDVLSKTSWNGWSFWNLARTEEGLDRLREKYLESHGEQT